MVIIITITIKVWLSSTCCVLTVLLQLMKVVNCDGRSQHKRLWFPIPEICCLEFFVKETDKAAVQCNLCNAKMAYHGSTSSMMEHIKRKHPLKIKDSKEGELGKKQKKIDIYTRKSVCSSERAAAITNLIAAYIHTTPEHVNMLVFLNKNFSLL